ncbi:MAG: glycosyl hydrolase [Terriglobia bacterium]
MAYSRRQFLAKSSAITIAFASATKGDANLPEDQESIPQKDPAGNQMVTLKNTFLNPAFSARPMTRWWWFGGAVTREEITRELTLMRNAGLRGVELQPVYPVEVDNPHRGIRNLRYFSPEWFEMLRYTVAETQRLGMQLDFTLGSGWPYGGPFIPVELAARKLQYIAQDIIGPCDFFWRFGAEFPDGANILAIIAAPVLASLQIDLNHAQFLDESQISRWTVPPGSWKIMTFVDSPTLQQVKRPTIGMEGYVLDHFNREALDLFLDAVGNRTCGELEKTASPPFHSVFCDSLEVEGADWTANLLREFRARRGYDFTPHLPALWQDAGAETPHVRYDYHLTLSELTVNNFFRPLAEWSKQHGMTARIQAHGAMGDVMQGYGVADIPEGEHYDGGGCQYTVDIAHRRLASSAGHIYQKPLISAETYTELHAPLFTVTLEMMKAATDAQFLDGLNQIVNQGYPYSPPQAGQPGWTFYAPTCINHNCIWWRHYPHLARYIQRTSALLQQGAAVNPIGVYLPLADLYAEFGAGGLHIDEAMERRLGAELVSGLRREGYDFDFINDHALQTIAKVESGRLLAGSGVYSAVIVPKSRYIPLESLNRLAEFAKSGGFLTFVEQAPDVAPGLVDQESRTQRLRSILNGLWENSVQAQERALSPGKGDVYKAANIEDALNHLQQQITPDFRIVEADGKSEAARELAKENVGFIHRRTANLDFYFISNISGIPRSLRAQFAVGRRAPQRWNAETGGIDETLVYEYVELSRGNISITEVQVRLEPFESCFIVFPFLEHNPLVTQTNWPGPLKIEPVGEKARVTGLLSMKGTYTLTDASGKTHRFTLSNLPERLPITGPWRLTLGDNPTLNLARLVSWTEFANAKDFSGWGVYEADFELKDADKDIEWILDLGAVHETAEVTLNDIPLGAAWKGLRRVSCSGAVREGPNRLKIEVGNLWINRVESLPKRDLKPLSETFGIRWGTGEEDMKPPVPPSGLLGPVQLIPAKRWTERF